MEYRYLGRSGLKVSVLTMGTMTFGGSEKIGNTSPADAARQVDMCLDAGSTSTTRPMSTMPACPRRSWAKLLKENGRRQKALVATKVPSRWAKGPTRRGSRATTSSTNARRASKRLKTDVIDLYQVHEWDGKTPIEETMEALDTLVRHGSRPLYRLLELFRLAHHEGVDGRRKTAWRALRIPADPLFTSQPRCRI